MRTESRDTAAALLAAALPAAVLVFTPALPRGFETPKDAVLCLAAGSALLLLALRRGPPPSLVPRPLAWPLAAWLIAGAAAAAWAGSWTHELVMRAVWALLFIGGLTAFRRAGAGDRLAGALVVAAVIESAVALVQYVSGPVTLRLLGSPARRWYAFGTLGVPNWVGALAAMALPPAILIRWQRPAAGGAALVCLVAALIATGSRGAWLAAAAGAGLVLTGAPRGQLRATWPPLAAGAAAAAVIAALAGDAVTRHDPGSVGGRLLVWRATAAMIAEHPLLGVGPGGFPGAYPAALHTAVERAGGGPSPAAGGFVDHAHNLLLQIVAENGLVGLGTFLWLVLALALAGRGAAPDPVRRLAEGATLVAFALYGLVDDPLASPALAGAAWLVAADRAAAPSDATTGGRHALRPALVLTALAAAAYGLLALAGERRLAVAWEAAARGDHDRAARDAAAVTTGPGRGEAAYLVGLLELARGEPARALDHLASSARTYADTDLYYARAAAETAARGLAAGLATLSWLEATLPPAAGPRAFAAELRLAAGESGAVLDAALTGVLTVPTRVVSPRLEVYEAAAAARLRPRLDGSGPAGGRRRRPLVVLDPGHGGAAAGATVAGTPSEKELALRLARRLAAALRDQGARVVLTRTHDREVSLDERARLANRRRPDLFVSLHANAAPRADATGLEVHVRSADPDAWPFPGLTPHDTVLFASAVPGLLPAAVAARSAFDRCGLSAAARMVRAVAAATGELGRGVRAADLYLLRRVQAPAVLVEVGFLSNPRDARRLARPAHRRALTRGLADGAAGFLAQRGACSPS